MELSNKYAVGCWSTEGKREDTQWLGETTGKFTWLTGVHDYITDLFQSTIHASSLIQSLCVGRRLECVDEVHEGRPGLCPSELGRGVDRHQGTTYYCVLQLCSRDSLFGIIHIISYLSKLVILANTLDLAHP